MEELLEINKYTRVTNCVGSILIPVVRLSSGDPGKSQNSVWRARLFENRSTECEIFLMELGGNHILKACSVGARADVHLCLDLADVAKYRVVCEYWHEILLKDSRRFAIRLDGSGCMMEFIQALRDARKWGGGLEEISGPSGKAILSSIRTGPPISTEDAAKRGMTAAIAQEHWLPSRNASENRTLLSAPAPKRCPLPPIPDEELRQVMPVTNERESNGSVGDLLRTFSMSFDYGETDELSDDDAILHQLTDEALLLEEAIHRGDGKDAAHWAMLLANHRCDLFVVHSDALEIQTQQRLSRRRTQSKCKTYVEVVDEDGYVTPCSRRRGPTPVVSVPASPDHVYDLIASPPVLHQGSRPAFSSNTFPRGSSPRVTPSPTDRQRPATRSTMAANSNPTSPQHISPYTSMTRRTAHSPFRRGNLHKPLFPEDSARKMNRSPSPQPQRLQRSKASQYSNMMIIPDRSATWTCWNCSNPNLTSQLQCTACESEPDGHS